MELLIGLLVVCALAGSGHCASGSADWCYQDPICGPAVWPTDISPIFCNGSRQSPIDINSTNAVQNANLTDFTFNNYGSSAALTKIKNTGHTVKVSLAGVSVSGGDLSTTYQSLQFHLHWGNTSAVPGSEHTLNGRQFPMEMHIVNMKEIYNGNLTQASADPEGIAALGFFIDVLDSSAAPTTASNSWNTLASMLGNITHRDEYINVTTNLSLDDLLSGVDRTKYYRYLGSFTTPGCNEIVVWTVFKDSIKVTKEVIDLFSRTVRIGNETSVLMLNTFRPVQPALQVTTNMEPPTPTTSSGSMMLASAQMAITALLAFKGF